MHLVTSQTGECRLVGKLRIPQVPGPLGIHGRNQITDAALKVHGMAAETVIHQERALVVIFIEEDLGVGNAVTAR